MFIKGIRTPNLKTRPIYMCMYKYGKRAKAVIYKDPHSINLHTKLYKGKIIPRSLL